MALPGFFPGTDVKREYDFYWQLQGYSTIGGLKGVTDPKIVAFKVYCAANMQYVSQLAKKVNLPADELDIENIKMGLLEYPVIKGIKQNDISVEYLEDTNNTVYEFHKNWRDCVLSDFLGEFKFKEMEPYCMEGWYIPLAGSRSQLEATGFDIAKNPGAITQPGAHIYNPISDPGLEVLGARGVQIFPKIFPVQIQRSAANREGTGVATVSVTYRRIPKMVDDPSQAVHETETPSLESVDTDTALS